MLVIRNCTSCNSFAGKKLLQPQTIHTHTSEVDYAALIDCHNHPIYGSSPCVTHLSLQSTQEIGYSVAVNSASQLVMVALVMNPASVSNNKPVPIPQNSRRSRDSFGSLPSASSPLTAGSSFDRLHASSPSRRLTELSQSRLSVDSRNGKKPALTECPSNVRHGFDPSNKIPLSVFPISSSKSGVQGKPRGLLSSSLSSASREPPSAEVVLQVCLRQHIVRTKFRLLQPFSWSRTCMVFVSGNVTVCLPVEAVPRKCALTTYYEHESTDISNKVKQSCLMS